MPKLTNIMDPLEKEKPAKSSPPPVTGIPVNPFPNHYHNNNPPMSEHGPLSQYHNNDPLMSQHGLQNQYPNNNLPLSQHGPPETWSSGLCDCCADCANCCITCWCPCITFGQIAEIVDKGTISCATSGAIYAVLVYFTGCGCIYSCLYRSKLRQQYMLPESPCNDCLTHCCCEPCALCQEYRELQSRGYNMSIGWYGNMERQNGGVTLTPPTQAPMFEGAMTR